MLDGSFVFFSLLDCDMFEKIKNTFPNSEVKSLKIANGKFFNFVSLKKLKICDALAVSILRKIMHTFKVKVLMNFLST